MKRTTDKAEITNKFEPAEPGISDMEIQEGIDINENDTGSKGLIMTLKIINIINGVELNENKKQSLYQNFIKKDGGINEYGINQIWALFNAVGISDNVEEKFSNYESLEDLMVKNPDMLLDFLSLNMVGKIVRVEHSITKKGDFNFDSIVASDINPKNKVAAKKEMADDLD